MTHAFSAGLHAADDGRRENGGRRDEETIMNDVFEPVSTPDLVRDEPHWIAAGHAETIAHPQFINPIITRFLTESAAYLGVNRDAHEPVNAPAGSLQAA